MKRKAAALFLAVLMTGAVAGFPVQTDVIDRSAVSDDPARFNITVTNDGLQDDRFRVSSILSPPVTTNWFDYEYSKEVPAGESRSFLVNVTPDENAIQQNYAFELNLRSLRGDELEKVNSYFNVKNRYDLSITSFSIADRQLAPGEKINISTTVKNTHSRTLEDFRVRVSGLDQQRSETGRILGAGNSIRYSFSLDVPADAEPGNRTVNLSVISDGERKHYVSQQIAVEEVKQIERSTQKTDQLLRNRKTFVLENTGNVAQEAEIEASIPVYMEPLVSYSIEPDQVSSSNGETRLGWTLMVDPGEKQEVSYSTDYTPALGFLALLFLGVLGFKKFQTDLRISKETERTEEGVKVRIEIENNSGSAMQGIEVKDFVPDIASVQDRFDFARPVRTETNDGTRLQWDIDRLEPGEQRILAYIIKPKVEVEGGAELPGVSVEKDGVRIKETDSAEAEFR